MSPAHQDFRLRNRLHCPKLACFGGSVGLELSPGVLLDRAVIERFVVVG
jgi:hypothetical protein